MKQSIFSLALLFAAVDAGTDKTIAPTESNRRPTNFPTKSPITKAPATEFPTTPPEPTKSPITQPPITEFPTEPDDTPPPTPFPTPVPVCLCT